LEIDQFCYIIEIVNHFGLSEANPMHTSLPSGADVYLIKYDEKATSGDIKLYQQIIGSLLYIQIGTCPDISFTISCLVQYALNPLP
jgi:hypothetical protein